jgi:predicted TPR repeat methyltransferase
MEGGVKFGVSSKGLGTLQERNGKKYVSEDYKLSTAGDCVMDPSAPDAYVNAIMESTEYDIDKNGLIYEIKYNIQSANTKSQLEEARLGAFKKLLNLIK